ncbi:MAG: hypothetical protein ACREUM_08375 [Nitrosospira sp.]
MPKIDGLFLKAEVCAQPANRGRGIPVTKARDDRRFGVLAEGRHETLLSLGVLEGL